MKKIMKITTICLAFPCLCYSVKVDAQALNSNNWTEYAAVERLEPVAGGWTWVRLKDRTNYGCPNVNNNDYGYVLLSSGSGQKEIYSTLLAAFISGKTVRIRVVQNGSKQECKIERIRIGS